MTSLLHRMTVCGLLAAALAGCSSTRTMASAPADARPATMFPLSAEQADRLLATAMTSEFPGSAISRVEFPNKGYTTTIRFLLDSHQITASMVAARGLDGGKPVDGFYFEVNDAGTMPVSGGLRAGKVFDRLVHDASQLAPALPQSR